MVWNCCVPVHFHEINIFGKELREVCKHAIGYKKSESGKWYHYCKAFPAGEGIPPYYPCNRIFENFVIRGQIEPPMMDCGKGYRFEFDPIHLKIKKYDEPELFKDKE